MSRTRDHAFRAERGEIDRAHTRHYNRIKSLSKKRLTKFTEEIVELSFSTLEKKEKLGKERKDENDRRKLVSRLLRPSCVLARTSTARFLYIILEQGLS